MTFEINLDALQQLVGQQAAVVAGFPVDVEVLNSAISTGSMSYTGIVNPAFMPAEGQLAVRRSLASFEQDWNAPGMEAYDEL